jgi:hypothetical protein
MVFSFSQARTAARSHARDSSRVLRAVATAATRASCSRCAATMVVTVCCPSTVERLELLFGIVSKMVVVRVGGGRRQALG